MRREIGIYALIPMLFLGCADNPALRSPEEFDQPGCGSYARLRSADGRAVSAQPPRPGQRQRGQHPRGSPPRQLLGGVPHHHARLRRGGAPTTRTRPPRLLFYFNGGLNSQALVEQQAARQVPCMLADGYYPVFFVWDTDGLGSYWEQVSSIWDGQVDHSSRPGRGRR